MGCCGGRKTGKGAAKSAIPRGAAVLVPMVYTGPRAEAFEVLAMVTRSRYCVPADGGERQVCLVGSSVPGVRPSDVAWFRTVDGGRAFTLAPMETDEPAPRAEPEPESDAMEEPEPAEDGES